MKKCIACDVAKPLDEYHRNSRAKDGRARSCKPCINAYRRRWHEENTERQPEYAKRWRAKDPARARDTYYRNTYRISLSRYEMMHEAQEGKCAVCHKEQEPLCVDHDHTCCPGARSCGKCVRDLLCKECNRADGAIGSDAVLARSLADYIDKWSA